MRIIKTITLLLIVLPLIAATCVTDTQQKGPAGPWVGEVVNTGTEPIEHAMVQASIYDADGRQVGNLAAATCPSLVLPGQRAAFELFWPTDIPAKPPLRATFAPLAQGGATPPVELRKGLSVRELDRNPAERYVLAEIRNDSASAYTYLHVCANLRDNNGNILEIGDSDLFPDILKAGERRTFPIFFNTMPPGTIEYFPLGRQECCSDILTLDPALFEVTATRIVQRGQQRVLQAVGELTNPTGLDLDGFSLSAHIDGVLGDRVDEAYLGCNGEAPAGGKAVGAFEIPLSSARSPDQSDVVITGVQAVPASARYLVPITSVSRARDGSSVTVTATLSNPTTDWLRVDSACFNLRDDDGRLVGTTSAYPGAYIAPGATTTVTNVVEELDTSATAEVIALASPQEEGPIFIDMGN